MIPVPEFKVDEATTWKCSPGGVSMLISRSKGLPVYDFLFSNLAALSHGQTEHNQERI